MARLGRNLAWSVACCLLVVGAARPVFGSFDLDQAFADAFNEKAYIHGEAARRDLARAVAGVEAICAAGADSAVATGESACLWPGIATQLLRTFDALETLSAGRQSKAVASPSAFGRSGRFSLNQGSIKERLSAPATGKNTTLELIARHLELTEALSIATANLRDALATPQWRTAAIELEPVTQAEQIEWDAIRFQSWIQSENPIGYGQRFYQVTGYAIPRLVKAISCTAAMPEVKNAVAEFRATGSDEASLKKRLAATGDRCAGPVSAASARRSRALRADGACPRRASPFVDRSLCAY
jgi:hypothetical protein